MRVLIVGSGISGLSATLALEKMDIFPRIIEKSPVLRDEGTGIALPLNAVSCLFSLGLKNKILNISRVIKNIVYALPSGEILSNGSLSQDILNTYPFLALHRKDFIKLLSKEIASKIEFSKTIHNIQYDIDKNISEVTFNDGEIGTFDLIIAADGVHSTLRQKCNPMGCEDLGMSTWRFIANYSQEDPIYFLGKKSIFMIYPISNDKVYCYAHFFDPAKACLTSKKYLSTLFDEYTSKVHYLIHSITEKDIIFGRLISVKQPILAFNNIAFIGDAAHACSPMLQQGAASALEDSITFAHMLKAFNTIPDALNHYAIVREPRLNWIKIHSDIPIKNISSCLTDSQYENRNQYIRINGPTNIEKWKVLFSEENEFIIKNYLKKL
jgi:2-polyprenyl-6-methoxyphenol hydroxylase-like FAD-dependent oxidoreductase